jgi:hypothetical protein
MFRHTAKMIRCHLRHFLWAAEGGVLPLMAIATPVLLGMAGIGLETGSWYLDKRAAQTAADAAAYAGALQRIRGSGAAVQQSGIDGATRNGFTNGGAVTVAVHNPPVIGPNAGRLNAVEAIVTKKDQLLLLSLLQRGEMTIAARAVAAIQTTGTACVLALDQTASGAVTNNGNATIDMLGCTVAANSTSSTAITISGSTVLNAYSLWTTGDYSQTGSSSYSFTNPPMTHAWPIVDPYAGLTIPSLSGCDQNGTKANSGSVSFSPGVYCNGLSIGAQATVTFQPGTYYIDRGDMVINAGAVVRCDCTAPGSGVTFVFTSTGDASQIGTVRINGGADVVLQAPTDPSYPYPGLLFVQDRRAPSTSTAKLNGGSTMTLTGSVYFPSQVTEWNGNNSSTGSNCVQIVALRVVFIGNSRIENNGCQAHGIDPVAIKGVKLVE